MSRDRIENAVTVLIVAALLYSVVTIYQALQIQRPPDMQNDVMLKSSPAANPPMPLAQ